ncbi:hypothetical protein [Eubacterium sp. 14-2]|uniref:hypothetical protein n=1 Tax=Eubacterium sp. 14-2 TaxID=1235790 RepID=UPI0003B6E9ED|nr:hypothetical protein [Eubacterium sp. 14-2]
MIRQIEKEELRTMHGREGLVLQGCGGDLKEWTDGINQMLEQEGILPKGKRLDDVAVFRNEGMTGKNPNFALQEKEYADHKFPYPDRSIAAGAVICPFFNRCQRDVSVRFYKRAVCDRIYQSGTAGKSFGEGSDGKPLYG